MNAITKIHASAPLSMTEDEVYPEFYRRTQGDSYYIYPFFISSFCDSLSAPF